MLHKTDQEFNHPLTYFYKTDWGPCLNLPENCSYRRQTGAHDQKPLVKEENNSKMS